MQVKFKAKCKECLCNKCCQDAFKKKKDCEYFTDSFMDVMKYFNMKEGKVSDKLIAEYLKDRQKRNVQYAITTLKEYALYVTIFFMIIFSFISWFHWDVAWLRISWLSVVGIILSIVLYHVFLPAFQAIKTIILKR